MGKALSVFWPGRDTGHGEPASCAGGRENSIALQAPGVFRLGLEVLTGTRLDEVLRVGALVSGALTRTSVLGSGRHARVCGSGGRAKQKRAGGGGGGRNKRQQWREEKDD